MSICLVMAEKRHPRPTANLEGWDAMSEFLSGQVAQAFEDVSEDDLVALRALDSFEADRIEARRRYEECVDLPILPGHLSTG